MTLDIGRVSLACGPYDMTHRGDFLSFSFDIDSRTVGTDLNYAKALRQQVLGLVDNRDETVIPMTWDGDDQYDGFYRITRAAVSPFETFLSDGAMHCEVSLRRIGGGYGVAPVSIVFSAADRDTTYYNPTTGGRIWFPDDWWFETFGVSVSGTRTTETGDVAGVLASTATSGEAYGVGPADYYNGSCRVEYKLGTDWYVATGRQLPTGLSPTADIRITNGLVRMTITSTTGAYLNLEVWDGTSWDVVEDVEIREQNLQALSVLPGTAVLRNTPDAVTIRTYLDVILGSNSGFIDLTIRRGMFHVAGYYRVAQPAAQPRWELRAGATLTAVTGGGIQTSAGATGHKLIVASPDNWDWSGSDVLVAQASLADATFMVGVDLNAASGATDIIAEYWEAVSERLSVQAP
jgi:hypothetical protein